MRVTVLLSATLLCSTIANAQNLSLHIEPELEANLAKYSFEAALGRRIGARCTSGDRAVLPLCAVARGEASLVPPSEALGMRARAIQRLNDARSSDDIYDGARLLFTAQLLVYRHEYARASDARTREASFGGLSTLYDYLSPMLSRSGDPKVARLAVWMAAQLRVEAVRHDLGRHAPTKRLTNLGNALSRYFDRSADLEALRTATKIHKAIVAHLSGSADVVGGARARLNLGNSYARRGTVAGIDNGRAWNGRAVETYAQGIELLLQRSSPSDRTANRLLTGLIAQMAQSLLLSPGDEYLNHRRAISTLEFARENFTDRMSEERQVEYFLAELGARIQIIDRLALPAQQRPQLKAALELFEREAPDAVERRPAPDTALGLHTGGTTLYAYRGSLTGDAGDCARAKSHWLAAQGAVNGNLALNASRLVYPFIALLECLVDVDPEFRGLDRLDVRRLKEKQRIHQTTVGSDALRPFATDELVAIWRSEAGEDRCEAARRMFDKTDTMSRLAFPEFWELAAVGHICADGDLDAFVVDVRNWLTEREQTRSQSRSGYALVARRDLQAITDLAIVLAGARRFDDAIWLVDFANRSRMSPGLQNARARMRTADEVARDTISRDIATWLKYDNPGDPGRSFSAAEFSDGQVKLRSEIAAARQSLGKTPPTPGVGEVTARVTMTAADRTIAWLLLGSFSSGWLIASPTPDGARMDFIPVDVDRARVKSLLRKRHRVGSGGLTGDFFDARNNAGAPSGRDVSASVVLWQAALADTASAIGSAVVAPLHAVLSADLSEDDRASPSLLTLVVRNELADLPLHAISAGSSVASCGDTLIDCFEVTWTGHVGAIRSTVREPISVSRVPTFWGFSRADLGHHSLAAYAQVLSSDRFDVTTNPDEVLDTLAAQPVGLWVLHGDYDPRDPGASAFGLQPGRNLTGTMLLSNAPSIKERRLQVLIGCDSAIFDTRVQPTEQTGLAEPFHQIGVDAVIVPSWRRSCPACSRRCCSKTSTMVGVRQPPIA